MHKTINRRVLLTVVLIGMLVLSICITATAASVKYDFTGYENADAAAYDSGNADLGGWYTVVPEVENGSAELYYYAPHKAIGVNDSISRFGKVNGENRIRYLQNWKSVYDKRLNYYWSYAFKNDEVFRVTELDTFGADFSYGSSCPWEADATITARFRVFVAEGKVDY